MGGRNGEPGGAIEIGRRALSQIKLSLKIKRNEAGSGWKLEGQRREKGKAKLNRIVRCKCKAHWGSRPVCGPNPLSPHSTRKLILKSFT